MRGSRAISLLIIIGLLVLVLAACSNGTPSAPDAHPSSGESTPTIAPSSTVISGPLGPQRTPPSLVLSARVNACTYHASEPTPTPTLTPNADLARPTSTPFPTPTPEEPSAEVVAYPDLPPPTLPGSVEAWRDAVVRVSVERASGRTREQQGLIVADGAVLTVLDLMEEVASLSVTVSGRGVFAAELERFDPRTGAALLTIGARDLVVAPSRSGIVAHGEPVLLLSRDEDGGELVVKKTYASPSLNAPDHLFALHADYAPNVRRGTVVVAGDGTPIGLAGHGRRWYGQQVVHGQIGGMDRPAILLDPALHLIESAPPDTGITPAAVVYHGAASTGHVDGPVTRELLGVPVQKALKNLGEPVPLENLGRHPRYVLRRVSGTTLELLYATPQKLRRADGELLGSARYIALWWDREGGAPALVLCGTDEGDHLGAAFATHGLSSFEALMEGAPSSLPHSMVAAERLLPRGYSTDDYQYPYEWELKTDKSAYAQDELVTLTFTITNISDWPVTLDYLPPRVVIHSLLEHRDVAVLPYGDGHRVLKPHETASFTMIWDQVHFEGGRATPGEYAAHVHLANLVNNWYLHPGPTAYEVILE